MRKHGGTPSRRDKHVTLAAISPPGEAGGRFVGGQQSGLAGSKPPPLFTRKASSCSSQGRRQGEPWGASPRPSAPTYLPPAAPPPTRHPNEPSMQGNRPSGGPSHRCGGRTNGKHHHSEPGGHHPPPRAGHLKPDASPPTSGHTPRPIPTTPGVAQQITPGEPHAQCGHPNRAPPTNRWGST